LLTNLIAMWIAEDVLIVRHFELNCIRFENLFYDVQVDSDAQFAAVLTAKLYNLDIVRGSPDPLEEYENPSSMETQVGSVERTRKATVPGTHNTGQR